MVRIKKLLEIERSTVAGSETSFHPCRTEGEGEAGERVLLEGLNVLFYLVQQDEAARQKKDK